MKLSRPRSITKKIKKRLTSNSLLFIDELNNKLVRGWATSKSSSSISVVIEISSSKEQVCVVANVFRPDVRRSGQHSTGLCGFALDISSWADKKVTVRILGEYEESKLREFAPSFFIHIPKTAGTSFKRAAEKYFGSDGIVKNYGSKSPETTPWVKDVVLDEKDFPLLYSNLKEKGIGLYTGHINAFPAANVFKIQNIITFVRNPSEQVISHYNHYSRWYEYTKSIKEFVQTPGFKNLQSRHLKGLPIQLVGFIGVTEQYSKSVDLFNKYSGWNLKIREDNVNEKKAIASAEHSIEKLISTENLDDFRLYACVKKLLEERHALEILNKEWCYSFIDRMDEKHISGIAYMAKTENYVVILILEKDKLLKRCISNELRPGLLRLGIPNKGFVGFSFALPSNVDLSEISVVVEATGQVLQRKFEL